MPHDMPDHPILKGQRIKLYFGTPDELGYTCGCAAHYSKANNIVFINIEHIAYGQLVMYIVEKRPRGLREQAAFDIAVDVVNGFLEEYLNDFFEALPEIAGAFKPETALPMAVNEITLELALRGALMSNAYDRAFDIAMEEMALDVAERKAKPKRARKAKPAPAGQGETKPEGRVQ